MCDYESNYDFLFNYDHLMLKVVCEMRNVDELLIKSISVISNMS